MGRLDSPLRNRMIFSVGARRSGTYWLQRIVTAHPDVAAVPAETLLFSHGIAPLFERFQHGARGSTQTGAVYVDRAALLDATRDLCDRVFAGFEEPGKAYIAERTSLHVRHLDLIGDLYPDARFVHIIRDGRDAARSLATMSWGPGGVEAAAREWRDSVLAARRARRPARYVEVRYEDLMADPAGEIQRLYAALELSLRPGVLDQALAESRIHRNLDASGSAPEVGKWRSAFTETDAEAFERVAGDTLTDLGYRTDAERTPVAVPVSPVGRVRSSRARTPIGARVRRLRSRHRPGPDPRARTGLEVAGELLEALAGADAERALALLAPEPLLIVAQPGGDRREHGAAARGALAALAADAAFRGRQRRGDLHHGGPLVIAVLAYEQPGGEVAHRTLMLSVRDGRIAELTVYGHSSRSP